MTSSVADLLKQAIALHQSGSLAAAEARYRDVLRKNPVNIDATYLLGMVSCQRGRFAEGIELFRRVTDRAPAHAGAHNLLGRALRQVGRRDEALLSLERAIDRDPRLADALFNRANVLADLGRLDEAVASFDQALAVDANFLECWCNRAAVLLGLKRFDEAIVSCDRALALRPDLAEVLMNRGNALRAIRRFSEALASYDRAAALRPNLALPHAGRALVLAEMGDFESVVAAYDHALKIDPKFLDGWCQRASALFELGRLTEALDSCARALALNADHVPGHHLRGIILLRTGRFDDALAALDRAIALAPQDAPPYADRAQASNLLGRFGAAFADLDRAIALAPDDAPVRAIAADIELLHGRWSQGWPDYERRLETTAANPQLRARWLAAHGRLRGAGETAPPPLWRGEPLERELLLLETEQGLGDCIMFARFAVQLAASGRRVGIMTNHIAAPLLATAPGIATVLTDWLTVGRLGPIRWLPLLSVPAMLGTTLETIPTPIPYLRPDESRVSAWRERIGSAGFKIGLCWQGNPRFRFDHGRSIPLAAFAPLADIAGVRLISLQKRPGAEQIASVAFGARIETPADDGDKSPQALLDVAAILMSLDLIVTSDSMLAHLAGALGRPVFVALRRIPDWRWMLERDDSAWYPSARLFRQTTEGDWHEVLERMASATGRIAARAIG